MTPQEWKKAAVNELFDLYFYPKRKLSLFCVANCKRVLGAYLTKKHKTYLAWVETFWDRSADVAPLNQAAQMYRRTLPDHQTFEISGYANNLIAVCLDASAYCSPGVLTSFITELDSLVIRVPLAANRTELKREKKAQADLFRSMFDPWRNPKYLYNSTITNLASVLYKGDLAVAGPLHDALLDIGATDLAKDFTPECKQFYQYKGYWATDLILGKEVIYEQR